MLLNLPLQMLFSLLMPRALGAVVLFGAITGCSGSGKVIGPSTDCSQGDGANCGCLCDLSELVCSSRV